MKKVIYLNGYRVVRSLNSVKTGEIVQTITYKIFSPLYANRGKGKIGFDEKRVKSIIDKIKNDEFYHEMSIVTINSKGITLDGANRIEAFRRLKLPVLFRVLRSKEYNGTPKELLNIVTKFNGSNPTWSANEQFNSALQAGSELAMLLSKKRAEVVGKNVKLAEKDFSVNLMMTIVERNKAKTHSRKRMFNEYFDENYLKYAKTQQFIEEFDFVAHIIEYFKTSEWDSARILKELLFVMWDKNGFDITKFKHNLGKYHFKITDHELNTNGRAKAIRNKVIELATRK